MATVQGTAQLRALGSMIFAPPNITTTHFGPWKPFIGTALEIVRRDQARAEYGAGSWKAVTPSDTVPLLPGNRGLFVSATGTVSVKGIADNIAVSLGTQSAGVTIPGRFGYVMATGTTATLVALYS